MALKKYRFPCAVVVADPSKDVAEKREPHTHQVLQAFTTGTRTALAGEEVQVEEAEAKRIYALVGTWEDYEASLHIREVEAQRDQRAGGKVTTMKSAGIQYI